MPSFCLHGLQQLQCILVSVLHDQPIYSMSAICDSLWGPAKVHTTINALLLCGNWNQNVYINNLFIGLSVTLQVIQHSSGYLPQMIMS